MRLRRSCWWAGHFCVIPHVAPLLFGMQPMTKRAFDLCILVLVIAATFVLLRYGREQGWMTSPWILYSCVLLIAAGLHLLVYRPLIKRLFSRDDVLLESDSVEGDISK